MAKTKKVEASTSRRKIRPALTPEAREKQLISLAYDLAEERLANGTATSQEVTHFLKLGTVKEQLEREKLEKENELLRAKTENLESQKRVEELYAAAISAMKNYAGYGDSYDDEEDEYY